MGHILSHPLTSKGIMRRSNKEFKIGSADMQGYRVDMEDTMTIFLKEENARHRHLSFFGVFDGHGGDRASIFCEAKFHQFILDSSDPLKKKSIIENTMKADASFIATAPGDTKNHGSTACFAMVDSRKADKKQWGVHVGNVGDSRAILIRKDGTFVEMTVDHKPETKEEEARIQRAGGSVSQNRVDGQLAMSRAIGDFVYKSNPSLQPVDQKVTPVPDVTTETAYEGDKLLICCDGIVEQLTGAQAAEFVHKTFQSGETDPAVVCSALLDHSLQAGSKDNHSAMIVHFTDGTGYETKANRTSYLPGPFEPFAKNSDFWDAYRKDCVKHGFNVEDKAVWDELMRKAKLAEKSMPVTASSPAVVLGDGDGDDEDLNKITHQKMLALMSILQGRPMPDGMGGAGGAGGAGRGRGRK